jgi:hypothetical protein
MTKSNFDQLLFDMSLLEERLRGPLESEDLSAGWNDVAVNLVCRMMEEAKNQLATDRTGAKWAHHSSLGRTLDMRWGICDGELLSDVLAIGLRISEVPAVRFWRRP